MRRRHSPSNPSETTNFPCVLCQQPVLLSGFQGDTSPSLLGRPCCRDYFIRDLLTSLDAQNVSFSAGRSRSASLTPELQTAPGLALPPSVPVSPTANGRRRAPNDTPSPAGPGLQQTDCPSISKATRKSMPHLSSMLKRKDVRDLQLDPPNPSNQIGVTHCGTPSWSMQRKKSVADGLLCYDVPILSENTQNTGQQQRLPRPPPAPDCQPLVGTPPPTGLQPPAAVT